MSEEQKTEAPKCPRCWCAHLIKRESVPIGKKFVRHISECRNCGKQISKTVKIEPAP